jgi:ribulose-bisphosphate carboxylase large chain
MSERIRATYLLETSQDPAVVAAIVAGEQSSGTFIKLPGEDQALLERAGARVEDIVVLDTMPGPSLPGGTPARGPVTRARMTLSWPVDNIGPSLTNLMAMVAGNAFELRELSGLRLLELDLPDSFTEPFAGPAFGVEGTIGLRGTGRRPMLGTIIKPSVGLSPQATADLVDSLVEAGIDFIKDDELQSDGTHCPFDERVRAVMAVVRRHADRRGSKVMYAFNLTGEIDEMRRRHDLVLAEGGSCVMVNLTGVGLAGVAELRRHSQLPLHGHRNGWGALSRHPALGWSFVAWQKIWRLAGIDHLHVNGLRNKFSEPDESVIASARACLSPLTADRPRLAMPVFSSGQTVTQVADTYRALGSADLIFAAGGGIHGHPDGAGAGVTALRDAWNAALADVPLAVAARSSAPLARALETFGA